MLIDWPGSIRAAVAIRKERIADDMQAYDALRADLRWLTAKTSEGERLLAYAFATLDGRTSDTFTTGSENYYTATEANLLLRTASYELTKLRDSGAVRFDKLPSNKRMRARYHMGDVDTLKQLLDDSLTPGAAAVALDLPVYAVEQIAAYGHLAVHDHPGVVSLRGVQVGARSVAMLLERLRRTAKISQPPPKYVGLRTALSSYPGEKSWGLVISAMLAAEIPFCIQGDNLSLRRIMIDPAHLADMALSSARPTKNCLGISHHSLRDVCEIFVVGFEEGAAAVTSANLEVVRYGAGKGIPRKGLANLITEIAFVGEAAAFTGRRGIPLHHEFVRIGVPRICGAWSREVLADLGFVRRMGAE